MTCDVTQVTVHHVHHASYTREDLRAQRIWIENGQDWWCHALDVTTQQKSHTSVTRDGTTESRITTVSVKCVCRAQRDVTATRERDITEVLGIRKRASNGSTDSSFENQDVAKLFFDTFSKRLGSFETSLKGLAVEVGRLKISGDQSMISDLVLLERLQKSERLLGESLDWIKQIADTVLQAPQNAPATTRVVEEVPKSVRSSVQPSLNHLSIRKDPSVVQPGSLNSITTPTELQVLTLLANQGPKSAPEIGRFVGRSREHTARLMRKLFDEGYVRRDQSRIPFRYSTVERVNQSFTKSEEKDQERESVSAPQA